MGWQLKGVKMKVESLNGSELWGTNFKAVFRVLYVPSGDKFEELPILDWHEKIMMNEHHDHETWEFETNMYKHNPLSNTLKAWPARYPLAYDAANGKKPNPVDYKGYSRLLTKSGSSVKGKLLDKATSPDDKAEAVRKYLQANGGMLEILIHDIPSINKPKPGVHKERLLLFNVGIKGGTHVKAYQYLDMDGSKPPGKWVRKHGTGWGKTALDTTGLQAVSPPAMVSNKRAATFIAGECW
jgi:hypothetical protein